MFGKIWSEFKKDEHVLIAVVIVIQVITLLYDIGKMALYFWLTKK